MGDWLSDLARRQPEKCAVIDDQGDRFQSCTYAELDGDVNRVANVLLRHGIGSGDRVVWCGRNSARVVQIMLAADRVGATAVPLNYRLTQSEAAYITEHCDASAVFVDSEVAPMFERLGEQLPTVRAFFVHGGQVPDGMIDVDRAVAGVGNEPPAPPARPGATIVYTSGTTGRPKGAFRSNEVVEAGTDELLSLIGFSPDDVHLTTGPLYHSGPGAFLAIALAFGQTVVLQRNFDPQDWLRLLDRYRCSMTFSAPTPIRAVCNLPDEVKRRYDRSSMRIMVANAAPWPFALKQQFVANFPPEALWEVYGSTELGINTVLRPEDQMRKPGSCGQPAPGVEIRLLDETGQIVEGTGPAASGELYVRSASVFDDYYKQHDRFEEDHRNGFQTVGDIAYRDDEGFFYICDRKKDMIISGGMNIYPAEIEAALESHPDVYEAAVFGIPSEEWGESVHAVVVVRPGAHLAEAVLLSHARSVLAGYKIPRSVSWMNELPKTGSGKLLKRELRRPYWEGRDANV